MITHYAVNFLKKKYIKGVKKTGGRSISGRVTVRGLGGGNKINYRLLDFYRRINQRGVILRILYDPNRTGKLGLILFENSLSCFSLIQKGVKVKDAIYFGTYNLSIDDEIKNGYSMPLLNMPLFSILSNVEAKPFLGSSICRAASTSCILIGKARNNIGVLKLNSNWELRLSLNCMSSYGSVSNQLINNIYIKKAGKNRCLGWKPKVRGVAKNPCDHPHGGGNGKRSKPKVPVNAWHTVFKWKHTKNKKINNKKRRLFKTLDK